MRRRVAEHLYDAIALGMRLYVGAAFRVRVVGGEHLRAAAGSLLVASHVSDDDVPVISSRLYFEDRMWARHTVRLHFAARDDLFERGVLAALAPRLPGAIVRPLYRFEPGPHFRPIRMHPIGAAGVAKATQLIRMRPDAPLDDMLPPWVADEVRRRAAAAGLPPPRTGRDADRAELVTATWVDVVRDEVPAEEFWRQRAQRVTAAVRELVAVLRAGEPLLLFPEGRPSPDGSIGPLRAGVGLLVRRGRPRRVLPIALAYDHLVLGRPRAVLAVGAPFVPSRDDVEGEMLAALRRTTPLVAGHVVAAELVGGTGATPAPTPGGLERSLREAVEEAAASGRPVEPELLDPERRRVRLAEALAAVVRSGAVVGRAHERLQLDPGRVRGDDPLARLSTQYRSMREPVRDRPAETGARVRSWTPAR